MKKLLVSIIIVLMGAWSLRAAEITWQAPVTMDANSIDKVSTNGLSVYAGNFGTTSEIVTTEAGAVNFALTDADVTNSTGNAYLRFATWETANNTYWSQPGGSGDAGLNVVMRSHGSDLANKNWLVLQNLAPGAEYEVQLFLSDDRTTGLPDQNVRTQYLSDNINTNSGNMSATFTSGDSPHVIGTFTADATSQTIYIHAGATEAPNTGTRLNGFQLRSETVEVSAWVDPEELSMVLLDPATVVTGTVDFGTTSSSDVDISITISEEQHPGSFSVLSASPQTVTSGSAELEFEFDSTVSNLTGGATSTGLVNIAWTEQGSGVTNDIVMPISVDLQFAAGANNNFNVAAGNWGDTSKWSLGRVPGTYGEDNARILYGYTATVATNFTGALPWTTVVQASSTLNIAADFLGGGDMYVPFGSGQVGTVNQSAGDVTTPFLHLGDSAGAASNSVYGLTGGELLVDKAAISPSGLLDINGGTLNINAEAYHLNTLKFGDTTPGGLIQLRSGTLTKEGPVAKNVRYYMDVHVSGGTVSHSGAIYMDNSEFRVIGDQASIWFTKYNVGQYSSIPGTTVFEMGTNGISTITANEAQLEYSTMIVDGSAYVGESATFTLIDTPSLVSICPDVTVTNFTEDYTAVVDQNATNVTLTITTTEPIGEIAMDGVNVDGDLVFSWDTFVGQTYQVQTNANLVYPNWGIFDTITGDGGSVSFTNTPDQDQLFYKVTSP